MVCQQREKSRLIDGDRVVQVSSHGQCCENDLVLNKHYISTIVKHVPKRVPGIFEIAAYLLEIDSELNGLMFKTGVDDDSKQAQKLKRKPYPHRFLARDIWHLAE